MILINLNVVTLIQDVMVWGCLGRRINRNQKFGSIVFNPKTKWKDTLEKHKSHQETNNIIDI